MKDYTRFFNNKQQQMEAVITKYIKKKPEAMYDIGVGPKTEWLTLKMIYPDLKVYGCEPQVEVFDRLKDEFPGRLFNVAIGQHPQLELFVDTDNENNASAFKLGVHKETRTVPAWTLDWFDFICGRPWSILLWMDIEGFELQALGTGEQLLDSGRVEWINLEVRRNEHTNPAWPTEKDIDHFLRARNYIRVCDYNRHPTHMDVIYKRVGVAQARK